MKWFIGVAAAAGVATVVAVAALCLGTGCTSLGYYRQSVMGHLDVMQRARPVDEWLQDGRTDALLRERLLLSQRLRDWAVTELKLPDNRSYRAYADLGRHAAVWNVVAAPELSLQLKTWCFPVVGCVGYRGYYNEADAQAMAKALRDEGLEVDVYGVPAYSTLGWTEWLGGDPLLSTFIRWPEGELARMLFHELAHQVAYADDDTVFNESFATAVERLGGQRWLAEQASERARSEYQVFDARRTDFRGLARRTRTRLESVFTDPALSPEDRRAHKAAIMGAMRADYRRMKTQQWDGFAGYDPWIERANNATLGVQGAYDDLVPAFERLFEREGRDFTRFYAEVRRLAALPKHERLTTLRSQL